MRKKSPQSLLLPPSGQVDGLRATMAGYLEAMAVGNLSKDSIRTRASDLHRFAAWCEERGLMTPAEVTRPLLERYQRHLFYYRKPSGQPLSALTQGHQLTGVRQYFRWLCRQGLLLSNPASELQLPKQGTRLPRYTLSVTDVEKVLALPDVGTVSGLRDRMLLELLWATGIRRAEVSRLSLYDVRQEAGTLFVRQGKGMKDRVVPISQRALSWVRRYLEESRPRLAVPPDDGALLLSDLGKPLSPNLLSLVVGDYVRASGVEAKGSCHLFRHACATAMLEGGADVRYVQELLGHSNLETTQLYTRVTISKLKAVYEASHPGARMATASVEG